ncbi:MAG: signal peptidase I [Bacilli bacterium]|nr:signal peptidase I [Bacilli bacterium]
MNKKNNDGKTFGDIFSKVNNDKVDFNNEASSDDSTVSTFNSIFDKVVDKKNEESKKEKSIFDKAVDEDKKSENKQTFANIFDKVDEVNKENTDVEKIETIDKEKSIFDKAVNEVKEEDDRSVSDTSIEENTEESFSDIFDKMGDSNEVEEKVSDTENIFFNNQEESEKEEETLEDKEDSKENEEDLDRQDNIFFNNQEESEKEEDLLEDKDDGVSSIFNKEEESEEELSDTKNLFFDSSNDIEIEKQEKIEEDKDNEEDKDTDVNPFFAEEDEKVDNGANPFFDNKINLIEKPEYSKNNVDGKIDLTDVQNFDVKIRKKKPNLVQAILGVLSYALFIWLLLIGVALLVYVLDIKIRAAKGDNSPPKYGAYVVLTGSMLPEIQVYDVVVTKRQDAKDLKEGDVITFASSDTRFAGTIITHRIIKKNYNSKTKSYTFQTKGDNNNVADSALVSPNNIFGRVILKIPKLGYLRDFLASDGGWILVILFPCLAVVAYDIVKISKGLKKKKYKNIVVQSR